MPIYEFACTACEKDFELLCPMGTEVQAVHCPSCGHNKVIRKLSLFGHASNSEDFGTDDFGMNSPGSEGSQCGMGESCGPGGSSGCECR